MFWLEFALTNELMIDIIHVLCLCRDNKTSSQLVFITFNLEDCRKAASLTARVEQNRKATLRAAE